jgi:folate-binding protein YgfZ
MTNDGMTKEDESPPVGHGSLSIGHSGDAAAEYDALVHAAGVVSFLDRTQIELTGPDRAAFAHNLCTNDIKRLQSGQGCEAFFTNVQGRILAHVYFFAGSDSLVIETVAGQAEKLLSHLDRYLITEKVEIHNRSDAWAELLLAGAAAEGTLRKVLEGDLPAGAFAHRQAKIARHAITLRRVEFTGPNDFLVCSERAAIEEVWRALCEAGAKPCGQEAFEIARIEHGTPIYGRDIADKNFPQELARNKQTISFTKGCYLGQETVARIDAVGHVNQTLCGVKFDGATVPPAGQDLTADGKMIGHVTSSTFSPRLNAPLALAYVRRTHYQPGTKLQSSLGEAQVIDIPLP